MSIQIIKGKYEYAYSSAHDIVKKIEAEEQRAREAYDYQLAREYIAWRSYFGVDFGQWLKKDLNPLVLEDRHAQTFNIIGGKVDILAAALGMEERDLDWVPIEGVRNSLTEGIKTSYYSDKDLEEYGYAFRKIILDGLIHAGELKMGVSSRHNPLTNIGLSRVMPGFFLSDPYWLSDDDWERNRGWEIFYLSAQEILDKYGTRTPMIQYEIDQWRRHGGLYEEVETNFKDFVRLNTKGHLFRVVEYHWMEPVKTMRIMGKQLGTRQWIDFPITGDWDALKKYMIENKVDPHTMRESPYTDRIHHVTTICPELTKTRFLEDGLGAIQIKRLPYFHFSANRMWGQDKGIVEDLLDIQRTINERETKLTDIISSASGGGKVMPEQWFRKKADKKRFEDNANDPGSVFWADGAALKEYAMIYLNQNQYPSTIVDQVARMYDSADKVSKVPPAMEAMSESSNESGVLFDRKLHVARMGTQTLSWNLDKLHNNVGAGYFEQWQIQYNGPPREFSTKDGRKVVLNERIYNPEDGKTYIRNRPAMVPRCRVVITESQMSPNKMLADRALYSELYNLSLKAQGPQSIYANFFWRKLLKTMPSDEEDKEELEILNQFAKIKDHKQIQTEIKNLEAQGQQADVAALQAMITKQQMAPQESFAPVDVPLESVPQRGPIENVPGTQPQENLLLQP